MKLAVVNQRFFIFFNIYDKLERFCTFSASTHTISMNSAMASYTLLFGLEQESQSADWRHIVVTLAGSNVNFQGWLTVYIDGQAVGHTHIDGKFSSSNVYYHGRFCHGLIGNKITATTCKCCLAK